MAISDKQRVSELLDAVSQVDVDSFDHIELRDHLRGAYHRLRQDTEAQEQSRQILLLATEYLKSPDVAPPARVMLFDIIERAYITLAPVDFHSYLMALEWRREEHEKFYQPRMKQLKPVVNDLTDMEVNDLYDYFLLSMPPGVGKTTLGLLFLSWVGGRDPKGLNLASGYAHKITKSFYDGINIIYDDPDYQFHKIFPDVVRVKQSADDLIIDFRDDGNAYPRRFTTFTCRSIDGSLTGATRCTKYLYVDDLVADIEEAKNPMRMTNLRSKYNANLRTRKKLGCKEIHIGTRWSLRDPIGALERELEELYHGDMSRVKIIRMPALDENDESNFDYGYGVGFSTEYFRDMRRSYELSDDVPTWLSLFQQEPIERDGIQFPIDKLNYFRTLPKEEPDDRFMWVDVAFGGIDNLSAPVAYQYGDDIYIADVVFDKGDYEVTEPLVAGCLVRNKIQRACFEANNGGDFYSRDVEKLIGNSHRVSVTAKRAGSNMSKAARIDQHQPVIRKFYFLHQDKWSEKPQYGRFMRNLTTYTIQGKNQHDDAPDSLAGLASMMRMNLNATIVVSERIV